MRHRRSWRVLLLACAGLLMVPVICGGLPEKVVTEILDVLVGPPSKKDMGDSARAVEASRRRDQQRFSEWQAGVRRHQEEVSATVSRSESVTAFQNMTFGLVDPKGRPARGVPVAVHAQPRNGPGKTYSGVTDSSGRLRVSGIGPLPASLRLELAPGRNAPDGKPLWVAVDPRHTEIALVRPQGRKIGSMTARLDPAAGHIRFVSAGTPQYTAASGAVYEATYSEPIVAKRNAADFQLNAEPGVRVYGASPSHQGRQELLGTVDSSGRLRFQLPVASLAFGAPHLRLVKELTGGYQEAVLTSYPHDPYAGLNQISRPSSYALFAAKDVAVVKGVDILGSPRQVTDRRMLGQPSRTVRIDANSNWLVYDGHGVWVKERRTEVFGDDFRDGIVERIRLVGRVGGSVGGLRVGDDWTAVAGSLGSPGQLRANEALYLDGGVVYGRDHDRIGWIEIARPASLLRDGTTAFVSPRRTRIFVSEFQGDPRCRLRTTSDFRDYLERTGVVDVVSTREAADYCLTASARLQDSKGTFLDLIPMKYEATTHLQYRLWDNRLEAYVVDNVTLTGRSKADYTSEIIAAIGIAYLLSRNIDDADVKRLLIAAIGVAGVDALKKSMGRAVERCPRLSEQSAFNQLSDKLYELAEFEARVTSIDYERGLLEFNVGTAHGVVPQTTRTQPTVFELTLGRKRLALQEDGLEADFYAAEVISATQKSCTAQLLHVRRRINKSREEVVETKVAPEVVRQIPDPTSGIVSGRARVRFLPLSG